MKKVIVLFLLTLFFSGHAHAKEVSYEDVVSEPLKYESRQVVMKGSFLYSEPVRQSFTIDQDGSRIEVFYSDLPNDEKDIVLAEPKFSKRAMAVTGTVKQYTNKARSFFMVATSVRTESGAPPVPSTVNVISYADILSNPGNYLNKAVTMKGLYLYGDPVRQSFGFDQNGATLEVLLSDLSRSDRETLLSIKQYSKRPVTVTGVLLVYSNNAKKYYMNAYSVRLDD